MIKLKPCPFCGEELAVVSKISDGCFKKYQIVCDDSSWRKGACDGVYVYGCGGSTGYYKTRSEAIDAWNTRVDEVNDAKRTPHGCWQPSEIPHEKYVCSHCGGACWYYDYEGIVAKSRFCPNCGAKMDEKER